MHLMCPSPQASFNLGKARISLCTSFPLPYCDPHSSTSTWGDDCFQMLSRRCYPDPWILSLWRRSDAIHRDRSCKRSRLHCLRVWRHRRPSKRRSSETPSSDWDPTRSCHPSSPSTAWPWPVRCRCWVWDSQVNYWFASWSSELITI